MDIALVIAGGSGNRMGQDIPKQSMHVDDCPIIIHTMACFQRHPDVQAVAVVCLNGWETVLRSYAGQFGITKLRWIFPGGASGMESIRNGIYGLREAGMRTGIVTSEETGMSERRASKMGADYLCQGRLGGKLETALDICRKKGITLGEVAYVGDGVNRVELCGLMF